MQPRKFASLRHCFGGAVVWFIVLMARLVFPAPMITRREPGERMSPSGTRTKPLARYGRMVMGCALAQRLSLWRIPRLS